MYFSDTAAPLNYNVIQRAVQLIITLQRLQHRCLFERSAQRLVLAQKRNPRETIPLGEVDRRRWITRLNAHHTRFDLWRRPEVVLAHFHQHVHTRQQLRIDAQTTEQFIARLGHQTLGELALEHEHSTSEEWTMQQQFEDERRTDLVRDVSNADVEKGQLGLEGVTDEDLQFLLERGALNTFLQFGHKTRIDFAGNHLLGFLQNAYGHVAGTGTDFQNGVGIAEGGFLQHAGDD